MLDFLGPLSVIGVVHCRTKTTFWVLGSHNNSSWVSSVVSCFPVSCPSPLLTSLSFLRLSVTTVVPGTANAEASNTITTKNQTMSFSDIGSSNMKSSSSRIQVKSESGIDPAVSHLSESLQKLQVGQPYVDSVCRAASIRAPLTVLYTFKF